MEESDPEFEAEYQSELKRLKAREKARQDFKSKNGVNRESKIIVILYLLLFAIFFSLIWLFDYSGLV